MGSGNGSNEPYFALSAKVKEVDRRMAKVEAKQELMDEVIKDIRFSMQRLMETCALLMEGFQAMHTKPERLSSVLDRMAQYTKPKPS